MKVSGKSRASWSCRRTGGTDSAGRCSAIYGQHPSRDHASDGGMVHASVEGTDSAATKPRLEPQMNGTRAPSCLAAVGMVIAALALSRPGALQPATIGYRLALSLPGWVMAALGAAALAMFLSIVWVL